MQPEVSVFGQKYKIGRMTAMQQFHVMRRLNIVCSAAGECFQRVQEMGGAGSIEDMVREKRPTTQILSVIQPLLAAVGVMTDADVEYVFSNCLGVVERRVDGDRGWAPVWPRGGGLMYTDIEMPHMIVLTWHVLRENVADFFFVLLSGLTPQKGPDGESTSSRGSTTGS